MISLRAFSEQLGRFTGLTPAALYERQRALVRMGMLPSAVIGRGHGLAATPETVATLLIAAMATDNLTETDERVRRLAKARTKARCNLTGKTSFLDAFVAILESKDLAERVFQIEVRRPAMAAVIYFFDAPGPMVVRTTSTTEFGRPAEDPLQMETQSRLLGGAVSMIGVRLRKAMEVD
jgi:hypothetical protein